MSRWIAFFIAILLGIAAGLYYGWVLNPVEYVDTTPDTLRTDYKTDYVLMVAEIYQAEGQPEAAIRRLALLGDDTPLALTEQALAYAQANGYGQTDLNLLLHLQDGLKTWNPSNTVPSGEGAP
jgi:hypothetical protein